MPLPMPRLIAKPPRNPYFVNHCSRRWRHRNSGAARLLYPTWRHREGRRDELVPYRAAHSPPSHAEEMKGSVPLDGTLRPHSRGGIGARPYRAGRRPYETPRRLAERALVSDHQPEYGRPAQRTGIVAVPLRDNHASFSCRRGEMRACRPTSIAPNGTCRRIIR